MPSSGSNITSSLRYGNTCSAQHHQNHGQYTVVSSFLTGLQHELSHSIYLSFNGHFTTWTWVSWYQNVSILEFIGAKSDGGGEW